MNPPVVYHPNYAFDIGPHVFPTEKYQQIYHGLNERISDFKQSIQEPISATRDEAGLAHTAEYLDDLGSYQHTSRTCASELPISKEIIDAYYLMTGGTMLAAKLAVEQRAAVHLGGGFHHAFSDYAEGFCYINDIAVAVRNALKNENETKHIERAAVIDTDLHQGNGTARIFGDDPRVFTFSIHQENNYPIKQKSDLDIGLRDGTGDKAYLRELETALQTIFSEFRPQLVLYVAGVDPYEHDQLGGLAVTMDGMKNRDSLVFRTCLEREVPIATVLAGGYAWKIEDTIQLHMNTYLALWELYSQ